jgi:FixJ family two-component response regulator
MGLEVGTVIIVDDDPSVRASLRRIVRTAGHAVRAYSSVAHLSRDGRPEGPCCLLVDLHLPRGTGPELKGMLDGGGVRVPTIFITGTRDVATAVRAMKSGAFDLLTKPVDVDERSPRSKAPSRPTNACSTSNGDWRGCDAVSKPLRRASETSSSP